MGVVGSAAETALYHAVQKLAAGEVGVMGSAAEAMCPWLER